MACYYTYYYAPVCSRVVFVCFVCLYKWGHVTLIQGACIWTCIPLWAGGHMRAIPVHFGARLPLFLRGETTLAWTQNLSTVI